MDEMLKAQQKLLLQTHSEVFERFRKCSEDLKLLEGETSRNMFSMETAMKKVLEDSSNNAFL